MRLQLIPSYDEDVPPDPVKAALTFIVRRITNNAGSRRIVGKAGSVGRVQRLIEDKAWTGAALALLELELPQWEIRRLAFEHGEWFCSLSTRPDCPIEFDEIAEAHHAVLPLAIMQAALAAWRKCPLAAGKRPLRVPRVYPRNSHTICCDNFG
jgi:hypothetical protein